MDLHILTQVHRVFHGSACTDTGPWCFSWICMYLHRSMVFFMDLHIPTQVNGVFHGPPCTYTGPWCLSWICVYLHRFMVFFMDLHIPTQVCGAFHGSTCTYTGPWCFSLAITFLWMFLKRRQPGLTCFTLSCTSFLIRREGWTTHSSGIYSAWSSYCALKLRSCVKVEVAILGSSSLIVLMVFVGVKQYST